MCVTLCSLSKVPPISSFIYIETSTIPSEKESFFFLIPSYKYFPVKGLDRPRDCTSQFL